jgi:uncharacterized protein YbaR (Trm112 family)
MEKHYICPKCEGQLMVGDNIILIAKNKNKDKGFLLLHHEIGNYTSLKHPSFQINKNEVLELICPLCHTNLMSDFDENLSHLILKENDKNYDIYFSRIAGEKSTYLVDGELVTATGEHSSRYTYFKMSNKFKQYLQK